MWSVVLKILSILGIVLLCLLALLLVALLLVLFWPVSYQGGGSAQAGEYRVWFRFRWLWGLVRGAFTYPESGSLQIKVLWLTIYDSNRKQEDESREDALKEKQSENTLSGQTAEVKEQALSEQRLAEAKGQAHPEQNLAEAKGQAHPEQNLAEAKEQALPEQNLAEVSEQVLPEQAPTEVKEQTPSARAVEAEIEGENQSEDGAKDTAKATSKPPDGEVSNLREKLQFYLEIVRDKDNQELVKHGLIRLSKILKSIRPRFLRAEALVGLGEPDLTGYVYGVYWAAKPFLGKRCQVIVTPDFDRRILEGEFALKGRIMAGVLVHHVIRVLLDKRLRQLIGRLKA